MRIFRHFKDVPETLKGAVVAIGNFVPSTADLKPMHSAPCATRPRNTVLRA